MRIAIIAETFLPTVNGVTHSLQRVLEHLRQRGDDVLVLAPSESHRELTEMLDGVTVHRLPSVPLARYREVRVTTVGVARVRRILADFDPDVVHLASPFELGWRAIRAAQQLQIPTVAVYQTDVPGYFGRYGLPALERMAWQRVINIHRAADRTLAPSRTAANQLRTRGVPRLRVWGRGVDTVRFSPTKRSAAFRAAVAPGGERIIGYVGRLAVEKQVQDLAALAGIPNTRIVIVGDGPQRAALEAVLPDALFTGFLGGEELATAMASFDLFVHPGELETFCQTIQEAMASGVPVIATGRGGPVDLVNSSRTGWLYPPGNLNEMRLYALDLLGDDAKRAAFSTAAVASVRNRGWSAVCDELLLHFDAVIEAHALTSA
ncbi:glycosyltransferase family 4 protein [Planctomonas psychrotolerans]|uniref:glycosyltransferase family 4 protein n=1 Tax=Planctomonas psychrotolerans TaxID=2528712 RepID=UPI00123AD2A8|nr:glycosyltransferase family 1 protein [Planctomonas psychrotolerans]